jgi:stage III sporulation protein AG
VAKWLEGLERIAGGGPDGEKRVRSLRWQLIIGGLGAALLLVNSFVSLRGVEPGEGASGPPPEGEEVFASREPAHVSPFEAIEQPLEARLKDMLEKIVGVGTVDVLVTVDSTEEIVYEKNGRLTRQQTDETDGQGGTRHITQITQDGSVVLYEVSGGQTPVVVKRIQPKIRGILVVAKGAENRTVRELILDAVRKGTGVPAGRISVVPRKTG